MEGLETLLMMVDQAGFLLSYVSLNRIRFSTMMWWEISIVLDPLFVAGTCNGG